MKKQVNYNGSLFDMTIDNKNTLVLTEVKSFFTEFCHGYFCKSNKESGQWKVELKEKYSIPYLGTHISYCKTKEDALALAKLTDKRLKELYPKNRKLKN